MKQLAILGTVGVPGSYGGFETLAENLVRYHDSHDLPFEMVVYCSAPAYPQKPATFHRTRLRFLPLKANGVQSIPYDIWSLFSAAWHRADVILLLGVSGAVCLPLIRLLSRAKIITNVDGIEWKRAKWRGLAQYFLRVSEWAAVRFSHTIIADNQGISDYISGSYGVPCRIIAYGGEHALDGAPNEQTSEPTPQNYALALCRIEPENNVEPILKAFSRRSECNLLFVGNWQDSPYGKKLYASYAQFPNIQLVPPVYAPDLLFKIRAGAEFYVHGHSAGGTNPSLVEMMHFGVPVLAFDCAFNRYTTEDKCRYFQSSEHLHDLLCAGDDTSIVQSGAQMQEIAMRRYRWDIVGKAYFDLAQSSMEK
ncbi:MAG: DUF1972 domain-containing protein [Rhodobacteraceae bacterium]|nr:DUF1972 domain-containing protein [Paracoccaceae bacterium]